MTEYEIIQTENKVKKYICIIYFLSVYDDFENTDLFKKYI